MIGNSFGTPREGSFDWSVRVTYVQDFCGRSRVLSIIVSFCVPTTAYSSPVQRVRTLLQKMTKNDDRLCMPPSFLRYQVGTGNPSWGEFSVLNLSNRFDILHLLWHITSLSFLASPALQHNSIMNNNYTPILLVVLVIASNLLMFNLGKSTTIELKSATTTSGLRVKSQDDDNLDTDSSPVVTAAVPKFDVIQQTLYKEASKVAKVKRQQFTQSTLDEGWNRGTGGLDDDDRLVLGELYYNATSVFEYGLGESTRIAAFTGVPRYAGVDSDPVWVQMARKDAGHGHFRFSYGDIGDTKLFGHPVDTTLRKIQYNYQVAPLALENSPFDVYLVDGRYRLACASLSFLHALKTGGDMEKVRVGIHDNDQTMRGYAVFREVAEVVIQKKKLWVYKLKKGITEDDLYKMWQRMHNKEIR